MDSVILTHPFFTSHLSQRHQYPINSELVWLYLCVIHTTGCVLLRTSNCNYSRVNSILNKKI